MSRAGVYLVTVKVRGKVRVQKVQAKDAADAERKVLTGEVIDVRFHGGSR